MNMLNTQEKNTCVMLGANTGVEEYSTWDGGLEHVARKGKRALEAVHKAYNIEVLQWRFLVRP